MAGNGNGNKNMRLRKVAIQMAGELPEDIAEARQILCLIKEIVDKFLANEERTATLTLICHGKENKEAS
jgi:hypothetical protein